MTRSTRTALLMTSVALVGGLLSLSPAAAYTPTVKPMFRTIAVGGSHTLVIAGDGKAYGTGNNDTGQLTGLPGDRTTLTALTGLPSGVTAKSVAGGYDFTLVVGSNGKAYGTGNNDHGQLTGLETKKSTLTPMALPAGVSATAVSAGLYHSLVLGSNGKVYGAGRTNLNQLTGGAISDRTVLTVLSGGPTTAKAIAAGGEFSLVLGTDGKVYGAGSNSDHQLTRADPAPVSTLVAFNGKTAGVTATAIAAGTHSSYYLGSNRYAYGVGQDDKGQLGDGTASLDDSGLPRRLTNVDDVVAISGGFGDFLAADSSGVIYGTGDNSNGQLSGSGDRSVLTPVLTGATSRSAIVELASGTFGSLARDSRGLVFGAGINNRGQLTGASVSYGSLTVLGGQKIVNYLKPSITGTKKRGSTLTAHVNSWSVKPATFTYRWMRNGVPISGATGAKYVLKSGDVGKRIKVKVTGARTSFTTVSAYSLSTSTVK